jgi:vacuolar-type H+-ATPase subunit D/Vma8
MNSLDSFFARIENLKIKASKEKNLKKKAKIEKLISKLLDDKNQKLYNEIMSVLDRIDGELKKYDIRLEEIYI